MNKSAKRAGTLALLLAGCAAAPAWSQTTGVLCDTSGMDRTRNVFTIVGATGTDSSMQCFINVIPKESGQPVNGQIYEGNYTITLSGGAGGGGGGSEGAAAGQKAPDAVPTQVQQHLAPGMYRLTLGTGGRGGAGCRNATRGEDGAPTSISNSATGALVAGFPRAEYYGRTYHSDSTLATARPPQGGKQSIALAAAPAQSSAAGAGSPQRLVAVGGAGGPGGANCGPGAPGGNGFISLQPAF